MGSEWAAATCSGRAAPRWRLDRNHRLWVMRYSKAWSAVLLSSNGARHSRPVRPGPCPGLVSISPAQQLPLPERDAKPLNSGAILRRPHSKQHRHSRPAHPYHCEDAGRASGTVRSPTSSTATWRIAIRLDRLSTRKLEEWNELNAGRQRLRPGMAGTAEIKRE